MFKNNGYKILISSILILSSGVCAGNGFFGSSNPNNDLNLNRAQGKIAGITAWEKQGKNPNIGTATTPEDVWNGSGVYTGFPTGAAEQMEIFSSDAADASAGTGARTVTIMNLLDGTGAEADNVTVALNGTTPVSLGAGTYYRSSRMKVMTAGSGGANAGTLTLRHVTTTANIFAVMPIDANQTAIMAYTVPLGKTLYVGRVYAGLSRASGAAGSAAISLRSREHGSVFQTALNPEITTGYPYVHPDKALHHIFPARTDVKISIESVSDNASIVGGEMSGVLVDD